MASTIRDEIILHSLFQAFGAVAGKGKLSTLIYHQVFVTKDPMRSSEPDIETFRWQMELVAKYFNPLSVSDALMHLEQGTLPANSICITFDDGYLNNLEVAAPILVALKIPATVYVATAFSQGENMWNDRLVDLASSTKLNTLDLSVLGESSLTLIDMDRRNYAAQYLIKKIKYLPINERKNIITQLYQANNIEEFPRKMMTPEQVKELHDLGIEIGAHTVDHPILKVLSESEQQYQIASSQSMLEQWTGSRIKGFAYPNGKLGTDYDQTTRNIVEQTDFEYAISTNWGVSTQTTDRFQLNRFTPWDDTPLKFHLRLLRNLYG